jgi:hypothetical protein
MLKEPSEFRVELRTMKLNELLLTVTELQEAPVERIMESCNLKVAARTSEKVALLITKPYMLQFVMDTSARRQFPLMVTFPLAETLVSVMEPGASVTLGHSIEIASTTAFVTVMDRFVALTFQTMASVSIFTSDSTVTVAADVTSARAFVMELGAITTSMPLNTLASAWLMVSAAVAAMRQMRETEVYMVWKEEKQKGVEKVIILRLQDRRMRTKRLPSDKGRSRAPRRACHPMTSLEQPKHTNER